MFVQASRIAAPALAAASLMLVSGPAASADYFENKTITVQVPSGSGGTYHAYCQMVQRNLPDYIPGGVKSVIQNLPGAGGAKSAAYMYNVAPKDGTYVAMIAPGTITVPLVRSVKFDAREFEWLGAPAARSSGVWMWHTAGITKLDQLKEREVKLATSGFASAGSVFPRLMNATLGTKIKLIYGYKGGGAINVSVERGETEGRWNFRSGFTGVRPTWIPEKKVIPVIKMGPHDPDPVYAGVPHFRDLLEPGSLGRKMYEVLGMNLDVGQAFYVPQGTPKEVVSILESSFRKMIKDPAFKDKLIKRRIEHSPKTAEELRATIKQGFDAATPEVVEELKKIFQKTS